MPAPIRGDGIAAGAKEVWFLNGYQSPAEQKLAAADFGENMRLLAAPAEITKPKHGLIREPVEVFANYRPDLSRGARSSLGRGRFLVVTVTKSNRKPAGTVFETQDGARFIFTQAQTLHEAKAKAAAASSETNVFAVRPNWSMPDNGWVEPDPLFWKSRPATRS
jgi:hypothetical protein